MRNLIVAYFIKNKSLFLYIIGSIVFLVSLSLLLNKSDMQGDIAIMLIMFFTYLIIQVGAIEYGYDDGEDY